MFLLLTVPSPPPVIINMPETGAPWWGVPVITASAVLFGALVAFLSARASDGRKAKRDQEERIMTDTRDVALEYLDAANALAATVRAQGDPSRALDVQSYLKAMQANLMAEQQKWGKFELFAHDNALEAGKGLETACLVLSLSAFQGRIPTEELQDFETAKYSFVNTLRKASGVGEIPYVFPDAATKERLDDGVASLKDDFSKDLENNFGIPRE